MRGDILAGGMAQQQLFERHPAVEAQGFGAKPADGPGRYFEHHGLPAVVAQFGVNRAAREAQGADRLFGRRDQRPVATRGGVT